MDTSVLIIGLIMIALFFGPLYFVMKSKKIDPKKVNALFAEHNQNNTFTFEVHLTHKKKILGLDAQQRGILYIDFNLDEPYVQFINLNEQNNSKLSIDTVPENKSRIKKIAFQFDARSSSAQNKEIVFYDSQEQYIVPVYAHEESLIAQKWQEAISVL